jgi:hypothetical protein
MKERHMNERNYAVAAGADLFQDQCSRTRARRRPQPKCCYSTGSIESVSGHAFSFHFIHDFFYFIQFNQFAAPEPIRPVTTSKIGSLDGGNTTSAISDVTINSKSSGASFDAAIGH